MEVNGEGEPDVGDNIEKKKKIEEFLSELKEAGYHERVAMAALNVLGPEDVDEGIVKIPV